MNKIFDEQSARVQKVWKQVEKLYQSTKRKESLWMWNNHVQVVAEQASILSDRFKGDKDFAVSGALLHDVGDVWYDRRDPQFEEKTEETIEKVLHEAGFKKADIATIKDEVIAPHSCYPDHFPSLLEGKILATADALAHLTTDFYHQMFDAILHKRMTKEEYPEWARAKLPRDFKMKIFFPEVQDEVEPQYKKLSKEFAKVIEPPAEKVEKED